jgi:hypothetical protein
MPQHESEWQTRKSRIDTRLKALGWKIPPFDPTRPLSSYHRDAITEYETANGPADYALAVDRHFGLRAQVDQTGARNIGRHIAVGVSARLRCE